MKKLVLIVIVCVSFTGYGQESWGAEFRPGLNIPFNDLGAENLEVGFGFEARLTHRLMPHFKAAIGWSYNNFETDKNEMKNSIRLNENSFVFGFELRLPLPESPVNYFVHAAGILGQIQLLDAQKTFNQRSDYGIGWQLGAGAEFALDDSWSLKPDIRFRSLSRTIDVEMTAIDVNLDYLSVGIGLSHNF